MVPCLFAGDSIALGVGQARAECVTVAKVGITSQHYVDTLLTPMDADTVVISLGVNDGDTSNTADNLRRTRRALQGRAVYWLLPAIKDDTRAIIMAVAREHGDRLIETRGTTGPDHLHPTGAGYIALAEKTKGAVEVASAPYDPFYNQAAHRPAMTFDDWGIRTSFRHFPASASGVRLPTVQTPSGHAAYRLPLPLPPEPVVMIPEPAAVRAKHDAARASATVRDASCGRKITPGCSFASAGPR